MEIELIMAMGNRKPNIYAQPCQQFGVSPQPVYFLGLNHFGFPIIIKTLRPALRGTSLDREAYKLIIKI